mgnify:CR=1 FL=1
MARYCVPHSAFGCGGQGSKGDLCMTERTSIHGQWSSRLMFILAAAGSAVGLGNIWKFPYITGEHGGGAFVLVYLACIALIGIPATGKSLTAKTVASVESSTRPISGAPMLPPTRTSRPASPAAVSPVVPLARARSTANASSWSASIHCWQSTQRSSRASSSP